MNHRIAFAIGFVASILLPASAHAQLFRTYLDPTGNDANPVSYTHLTLPTILRV